jgi:hypothetical protein
MAAIMLAGTVFMTGALAGCECVKVEAKRVKSDRTGVHYEYQVKRPGDDTWYRTTKEKWEDTKIGGCAKQ